MKVIIVIDCEDESEILQHLTVMKRKLQLLLKKRPDGVNSREILEDTNCYGYHKMIITTDKLNGKEKKKR
jgi:hypothetical protein